MSTTVYQVVGLNVNGTPVTYMNVYGTIGEAYGFINDQYRSNWWTDVSGTSVSYYAVVPLDIAQPPAGYPDFPGIPPMPFNVQATGGTGTATISWSPTAVKSGDLPIISYQVGGGSAPSVSLDASTFTYTYTGLAAGTYIFFVSAINGITTGPPAESPSTVVS